MGEGLLDFIKTPEGQGLLAATFGGLATARKGAPINSLGKAGLAGLMGYGNALDRNQQTAQEAQNAKFRDLQTRKMQGDMDREAAQFAEAGRVRSLLSNAGRVPMGKGGTADVNSALPADLQIGALPPMAQAGKIDYQELIRQGVPFEQVKALAEAQNLGRAKVARTADIEGPGGAKTIQGYDEYGQPVGQGANGYIAPVSVNQGNQTSFVKPMAGLSLPMGMSPSERDASARGWASNGLQRERLNFDKSGGAEGVKPQYKDGQWVTPPSNMGPGQAVPAMPSTAQKDANEALQLIRTAKTLIPKSTGSYIGAGVDQVGRLFGASTGGDTAAAQLKALEGALVSKMPKMSGPQSDKDVLLYKQMAGEIGDPTIPGSRKMAALQVIEEIQQRHSSGGASGGWGAPEKPKAGGGWSIQKAD